MLNPDIIREKYASMTDEQLIYLAKEDSYGITAEALAILKEEFIKRNIDISIIAPVEKEEADEEEREPIAGFYNPATGAEDALLGRNYLSIKNPVEEKELAEAESKLMASLTTEEIERLIEKCNTSMLINGIIFIAGMAVTLVTYTAVAEKGGSYFVAWGAIVFGGYRLFKAFDDKRKYKTLLTGMHSKKEEFTDNNL